MPPEKETSTRKFVGLDEKGYETSEPTQYVEVLEGETPTRKSVEEVVAEFQTICPHQSRHCKIERCFGACMQDIYVDWLRTTLLARDAENDARLREVVKELFAVMDYQNTERELNAEEHERMGIKLALQEFKLKFAAKYGITNL